MFILGITDTLESIASVADKVSYNVSYVDGTTVETTQGLVGSGQTTLHTAAATTRVLSVSMSNTHTSAITVTLSKDPTNAGTLYHYFETISLGVKYTLVFDGQRLTVMDASGAILSSFSGWDDGATTEILVGGGVGSAPVWTTATGTGAPVRAGAPTLTGQATIPTINLTGGQITFPDTAVPSADPNTLDDYEEGTTTAVFACTTSGTITLDASHNTLAYTKIGTLVHVQGRVLVDSVSSPVGTVNFSSFPTNGGSTAEGSWQSQSLVVSNFDLLAGSSLVCGFTSPGGSIMRISEIGDNLDITVIDAARVAAADYFYFNIHYISA